MSDRAEAAARDLTFGLLALREGRVDPERLAEAFREWSGDGDRPLAAILVDQGSLDADSRTDLERLAGFPPPADEPDATVAYTGPPPDAGDAAAEGGEQRPRFRVLRSHARGGLGEVFVAVDPELNREVALKEMLAPHADDPSSRSRFLLEAEVTGRLEHPGVVPVYALGRYPDGRPYYATRFVEGETLKDAVDRFHARAPAAGADPGERELAFRRLLRSVITACQTVAYAHERGVVHRDLKPQNILLGRFGETLVVDWGVAKVVGSAEDAGAGAADPDDPSLTGPGSAVGTPSYMSPEQAAGGSDAVGPAADVYGLGATLYCVLVGHAPFTKGGVASVLRRAAAGEVPRPRSARKGVDPALEAVCLKAMAKRPEDRYETPLAMADDLERWLADVRFRAEQAEALGQARRSLARLCLERGQNLFGRERHGEGLLWLARALASVPDDADDLDRAVRTSLGGWHAGPAQAERTLGLGGQVHALAFSPDGRCVAGASGAGHARLWDASTGKPLAPPMPHDAPVRSVAFRPDGATLATAGDDGTVRFWDARTGEPSAAPVRPGGPVRLAAFSPDGLAVATAAGPGAPCLWDAATGARLAGPPVPGEGVTAFAFSPDGALLAAAAGPDARVWDVAAGRWRPGVLHHPAAVLALAFSPDGRTLLTGARDGRARAWDVGRGALAAERPQTGEVGAVGFNPADGRAATACHDGTVRLWDAALGEPRGEPLSHRARVHALAFSPDGRWLASASWDGCSRLWDAASGLPVAPPLTHKGTVLALAFSPDARRLVTGGADGLACSWRVPVPVDGTVERVDCWVRLATDLDFDPGDGVRRLDPLKAIDLRRRLIELGGPPVRPHT